MNGEDGLVDEALDALDDVFYVYDAAGKLVRWNERLEELFGLQGDELRGRSADSFFLADDREAVREAVAEARETGETTVQARADTEEGTILFELSGRALTGGDGEFLGLSGIGRDVTAQREREWRLARQNERLEEFADILAHDLRNPLSVAAGYLEIARAEHDSPELAEAAAGLSRIEDIVRDVLTAARQGTAVTDPEPVPLAAIARSAWETADTGAARIHIEADRVVTADAARFRRLLENLYRNAVEHGSADPDRPGGGLVVTVGDTENGFFVADDGTGFGEADPHRAFEPGYSSSDSGTGLGLSIVRSLADAHGWSVEATTADDGGACFVFDLHPIETGDDAELGV